MIQFISHSQKEKTNYWEQVNCCQGLGVGNIVTLLRGWHEEVLGVMELFCSLAVVLVTVIYIGIKINRTVQRKIQLYCRKFLKIKF